LLKKLKYALKSIPDDLNLAINNVLSPLMRGNDKGRRSKFHGPQSFLYN